MNTIFDTARGTFRMLGSAVLAAALAACSLTPDTTRPQVSAPTAFKETPGAWQTARPAEAQPRGEWWKVFNDADLNALEAQALLANQNLKAAAARVTQARSIQQTARAGLFPTLDAGAGPTREKLSPASQFLPADGNVPSQTLWRAQASASYEVDLFGRVSASVDAAKADTAQSEALFQSVRLALQADVAQNYFNLRTLDGEQDVLHRTVALREQALALVQHRFKEGEIGELDQARARSELASARSDELGVARMRAASEHSLAVLLGEAPASFSVPARPVQTVQITLPPGLPSSLLERRPDISAAEQAMAAANARIGVARAAFFPSLTLTGSAGFESGTIGNLFQWSSRTFLLGPFAGTALNIPIFDGGARRGRLANARAHYEEDVALYRQQVLVAFQEVEDNLANLRLLDGQLQAEADAVQASGRAAQLSRFQYTEGSVSYLDVIDADRSALQARRTQVQLTGAQAVATVNLIRALGGGWSTATTPPPGQLASR